MDTLTLQEAITRVADNVRDATPGVSTASSAAPNQMIDTGRRGIGKDREWNGSQVLFLQPEAGASGIADNTAYDVTGYETLTGTFTFSRNVTSLSGVPQNVPYLIIRSRGQGHPYRAYIRALDWALKKLAPLTAISFTTSTVAGARDYVIPDGIRGIYDVVGTHSGSTYGFRPLHDWDVLPGRILRLGAFVPVDAQLGLTVYGMAAPALPTTLLGTITADADELIDFATEYLMRGSPRPQDMQKAGGLQQERIRLSSVYLPANYVEVI